jgi:TRAP transporter TAXI family solute receptor
VVASTPAAPPKPAAQIKDIAIGCKPSGSSSFIDAAAIAKMFSNYIPGVKAHGAVYSTSAALPSAIQAGEVEMAVGTGSIGVVEARYATGEWKGAPVTKMRVMSVGERSIYLPLAKTGSGIKSVADFKGKRAAFDQAGSASVKAAYKAMLSAYGLTPGTDLKILTWSSTEDMVSMMREGKADVCAWYIYAQTPFVTDMTSSGEVYLVGIPPDKVKVVTDSLPGAMLVTFPKGTYKGQDTDISGFGNSLQTLVRDDMPDDLVYAMTAAIYDHFDEFVSFRAGLKESQVPESLQPDLWVVPFHNGAIKYFKEKGFWKAEHQAKQDRLLKELTTK